MFVTLMYHLVDDRISHPMSVPQDRFERQITWLAASGARLLTADQADGLLDTPVPDSSSPDTPLPDTPLPDTLECGRGSSSDAVFVTFDDGYLNTVDTALPVLRHHGVPAMMAVCGSYLDAATMPAETPHASDVFARARDVQRWLDCGYDIAAHGYRHRKLTDLPEDDLRAEVGLDHAAITAAFGFAPRSFCYPFGSSNRAVRSVVGEYYRTAYSTDGGHWPGTGPRLTVRRLQVRPEWSVVDFANALAAARQACTRSLERQP
ncbi:polysaccharide deacetylase family protein [Kitasatospora viridis]|uniref:Peptidoglycan/xylan/chitin deacetylase (PgdA/CDA1 family) n=1 Tax=Kitasatospora viridis TaxID=281105 RepID=A0A561SDU3_9ACTN|nr:polysaccharide deacetylase family protein [Kitasatospora viridis]TWF73041.1 peptidoglycan/xylan/chitin deacetylase (PgdA/CDA1 family) [Kitasatospora viridis]